MKKIITLLVDDEISALRTLRGMLNDFCPEVEIISTASSVKEAVEKTKRNMPELVFLDVEMPPFGSGFDFLKQCQEEEFGVIFTTAYPEYAIEAINAVQPWAYLVKPFSVDQLRDAVSIAMEKKKSLTESHGSIIFQDKRKGNIVVRFSDIQYCKADSGFMEVYYVKKNKEERVVVSKGLRELKEDLPIELFCRCHHGFLVNLSAIGRYEKTGRNGIIYLKGGEKIPVSIGKKEEFEKRFENFLSKK